MTNKKVLLAKPGLDGHDVGVRLVATALREAGLEVLYLGMRQTAEQIVSAAVQEDVGVIGVSLLSGTHLRFAARLMQTLRERGIEGIPVIMGGVIPEPDIPRLQEIGIEKVFPVGSSFEEITRWVSERLGSGERHV